LLVACRHAYLRIGNYGFGRKYEMTMNDYYGRNTLYRLLRPIAIAELIERQMTYADFSVDPTSIEPLRFKKAAFDSFSNSDVILKHPNADWDNEIEHIFSGSLSRIANNLIIKDENISTKERPMHFHEFEPFIDDPEKLKLFSPFAEILHDFEISKKPIFWIRLVCYGYICQEYVKQFGGCIRFKELKEDYPRLLSGSPDEYTASHIKEYVNTFQALTKEDL
jgi:hypothetical protein